MLQLQCLQECVLKLVKEATLRFKQGAETKENMVEVNSKVMAER